MEVTFTEKQAKVVLFMIAKVLQDTDDDDVLDELAQTAVGAYLDTLSDDELAHYGVLGMKWGVRRATRGVTKMEGAAEASTALSASFKDVQHRLDSLKLDAML